MSTENYQDLHYLGRHAGTCISAAIHAYRSQLIRIVPQPMVIVQADSSIAMHLIHGEHAIVNDAIPL